jgi:hypothetical protein
MTTGGRCGPSSALLVDWVSARPQRGKDVLTPLARPRESHVMQPRKAHIAASPQALAAKDPAARLCR